MTRPVVETTGRLTLPLSGHLTLYDLERFCEEARRLEVDGDDKVFALANPFTATRLTVAFPVVPVAEVES